MAKAEKCPVVVEPEVVIVLTLSTDEASTLRSILDHIAGSPTNSPRKHADSINAALRPLAKAGPNCSTRNDGGNALWFDDYRC